MPDTLPTDSMRARPGGARFASEHSRCDTDRRMVTAIQSGRTPCRLSYRFAAPAGFTVPQSADIHFPADSTLTFCGLPRSTVVMVIRDV